MTDRIVRVRIEGDSASLDAALAKSERGATKLESAIGKTGKESDRLAVSMQRTAAATDKMAAAKASAEKTTKRFAQAAQIAKSGITDTAGAIIQATSAFGPYGAAIGLAVAAVWGLVQAENEATKKSKEFREELAKARRDQELQKMDQDDAEKGEVLRQKLRMRNDEEAASRAATQRSIRFALEDLEKKEAKGGRGAEAARREIAELRALNAESSKDFDGSRRIRHEEELRLIALKNQVGEKKKLVKLAGNDRTFDRALGFTGFSGNVAGASADKKFAAETRSGPLMRNNLTDPTDAAANTLDEQMRAIEMQRATSGESIELINRERDARLELLAVQREASVFGAERAAIDQEVQQVNHEATLARIAQEQAAEEALMARRQSIMAATESIANSGVQLGSNVAKLAGVNAKKREKIERALGAGQAIVIGMLESVRAAAAFASLNPIQGALHLGAAAAAFTTAAVLGTSGGGGGSSGGGSGSATQFTTGASSGSSPPGSRGYDGPIPGSPGPNTPSTGGSGGQSSGGTVIHISGNFYGTPKREFVREIDEQLGQLRHHGRARRDV